MAFKLDDIVIDRIQYGIATDMDDQNLLYTLTQLQDASVDISAESKESRDKDGTLIKKFWTGKSGTFTATNAMINLNILGATSGSNKKALESNVQFPAIRDGKPGETLQTPGLVAGTVKVHVLGNNGTMGENVTSSATISESAGTIVLPNNIEGASKYIVEYMRTSNNAVVIQNRADKFPSTVRLVLKVLAIEPCSADTLRAGYLILPSFQVSPETSVSLTTD